MWWWQQCPSPFSSSAAMCLFPSPPPHFSPEQVSFICEVLLQAGDLGSLLADEEWRLEVVARAGGGGGNSLMHHLLQSPVR